MLQNQLAGFIEGVFFLHFTNWGKQAPPGQFLGAENASFCLEVAPEHRQRIVDSLKHRFKRCAVNPRHVQRGMEAVLSPAFAVECDHFPFDSVQTGSQGFFHFLENFLFAFIGAFPNVRVWMGSKIDQRRQRQQLRLAIQLKFNAFLRGEHSL